jgi:Domain of unknown function (DUF4177)
MTKWEYKFIVTSDTLSGVRIQQDLNNLGKDGWELCGVQSARDGYGGTENCYVFKRPHKG